MLLQSSMLERLAASGLAGKAELEAVQVQLYCVLCAHCGAAGLQGGEKTVRWDAE